MYSSRNRRRDKTIKLWDTTSGALNRSIEAHSGARLVSGVLSRQHPDMSFGTDNTSGGMSYALKLCDFSKCARFRRNLTPTGHLKANP
jgi:WD40 repeat protein